MADEEDVILTTAVTNTAVVVASRLHDATTAVTAATRL